MKSKAEIIADYIRNNMDKTAPQVAKATKVSLAYVYKIRGEMRDYMQLKHSTREAPTANDKQVAGSHYKDMAVQPWNVVDSWPVEQRIGYYRGGALKYIMRMGSKDQSATEIAKGVHYLEKLLEVLKSK